MCVTLSWVCSCVCMCMCASARAQWRRRCFDQSIRAILVKCQKIKRTFLQNGVRTLLFHAHTLDKITQQHFSRVLGGVEAIRRRIWWHTATTNSHTRAGGGCGGDGDEGEGDDNGLLGRQRETTGTQRNKNATTTAELLWWVRTKRTSTQLKLNCSRCCDLPDRGDARFFFGCR